MSNTSNGNTEDITSSTSNYRETQKQLQNEKTKYFIEVLQENGIILNKRDKSHILIKEQSLIIRDINKTLAQEDIEENTSKFLLGVKELCKKKNFIHVSLLPTVLRKEYSHERENESIQNLIHQESLFRILLQINCIQNEIMNIMLKEAIEEAENNEETSDIRLILNAIKFLPSINSSSILTQKLLDIIEIGSFEIQLDVLNSIPEIIPDSEYESMAKQLSRVLESNDELTGAIIDCLNSLNLSSDTRLEIQQYIIEKLLSSTSIEVYPILFDFLINDCKPINLPGVLLKCRDALNEIMRNETTDKEKESRKVVIMNKLHMSAFAKVQYEGWMNLLINIKNFSAGHKPIDFIILAMLHSTGTNRKKSVEILVKKHVKGNLLKKQHLEAIFQKYFIRQIFNDYFSSIIDIASSLLKNCNELSTTEFASDIFKQLFENDNIDRIQRQDILHTLILLTSSWEAKNVGDVLKILFDLTKGEKLQGHIVQLMGLLEKIDSFELRDIKMTFEILCFMICHNTDEVTTGLKNELHILIRKQLSSAKRHLKQWGIIAAIVMAKQIATISEDQDTPNSENSFTDIANLPHGAPQESACLLDLASSASSNIPELMGLYYDQLASMLSKAPNLDVYFTKWLQETIQNEFEDTYTTKDEVKIINQIPLKAQFCLNEQQEIEESICVNIAGLTIKPSHTNPIVLLSPLFRLFRILCVKNQGDLEMIDALLGCGVILPELDDLTVYDSEQCVHVANCLFHCINWFRECISAFITQTWNKLRLKLLDRLKHIVELEAKLNECLNLIPDHKLPSSYFYNALQSGSPTKSKSEFKVPRPRKKLRTNTGEAVDILNDTVASTSTAITQRKRPTPKRPGQIMFRPEFREIDTDVIILLKYSLNLNDIDNSSQSSSPSETKISITAFQYVLSDIVIKLNLIVNSKHLGMSNLNDVTPTNVIKDCIKKSGIVFGNFQSVSREIGNILEDVDGLNDHIDLYTPTAKLLKKSFTSSLEFFMLIFSWTGFDNPKNLNILKDCLKALTHETSSQSVAYLSRDVVNKLTSSADHCLDLQSAVYLIKTMQALLRITPENNEIKKRIAAVSGNFLNKKWFNASGDLDGGKIMYENIDILIKAYLEGASIKVLSGIVSTLQEQAKILLTKDNYLEMLESINKTTFYILFRNICHFTLERIKIEVSSLTNKQHLVLWKTAGVLMQGLMSIVNSQSGKSNLLSYMKKSIGILKIFLSHGIPILEMMLKSNTDEVVEILKTLQLSTRYLHCLCCTSKLTKDSSIMTYVPQFKHTLETLIFRVKAALVANNCSEAFWMGILKNKNIDGEVILTQNSDTTSESNENDEEELPPDDSDEEIFGNDEVETGEDETTSNVDDRSASEIFD